MYSRAERKFEVQISSTSDNPRIAPGAYSIDDTLEKKRFHKYAPFLSLSKKVSYFDETVNFAPAPGIYELNLPFQMVKPKAAQPAIFGKSKAERFEPFNTDVPGPGAYSIPSQLNTGVKDVNSILSNLSRGYTSNGGAAGASKGLANPSSLVPQLLEDETDEKGKKKKRAAHKSPVLVNTGSKDPESTPEPKSRLSWTRKFVPPSIPSGIYKSGYEIEDETGKLKLRHGDSQASGDTPPVDSGFTSSSSMNSAEFGGAPSSSMSLSSLRGFAQEDRTHDKGTSFGKSKSERGNLFRVDEGPGPGNYNVVPVTPLIIKKGEASLSPTTTKKVTAPLPYHSTTFKKDTVRNLLNPIQYQRILRFSEEVAAKAEKQNIPGPGAYSTEAIYKAKNKSIPFAMTQSRETGPFANFGLNKKEFTPGPGAYFVRAEDSKDSSSGGGRARVGSGGRANSILPTARRQRKKISTGTKNGLLAPTGTNSGVKPFNSTSSRFKELYQSVNKDLGPGCYKPESSELVIRKNRANISFDAMAPRTASKPQNYDNPGPFEYQKVSIDVNGSLKDDELFMFQDMPAPSSMFASYTERFSYLGSKETPAPGSYEVSLSYQLATEKGLWWLNKSTLNSGTKRETFKVANPFVPGPGKYNPMDISKTCSKPNNVDLYKHADIANRFQAKTTATPGPGYYGADRFNSPCLLKKTFNVTLDPPRTI